MERAEEMKGWLMYSQIQGMKEHGFSIRQVSRHIRVSRSTIKKYWEMKPEEYAERYKAVYHEGTPHPGERNLCEDAVIRYSDRSERGRCYLALRTC